MKEQLLSSWWLIGLSVMVSVIGQTILKLGVRHPELAMTGPMAVALFILRSPLVMLGLLMYSIGALAWIVVLSRLDLSYAYPFLALNFVLVAIVSRVVLAEAIPGLRWLGIGFICVGILLVARSAVAG
jgi:drug/metabolite transporter (DMT)-like permease